MIKSKVIKIDDVEVTIKELKVKDIFALFSGEDDLPIMGRIDDFLYRCSDLKREQLLEMTPTDIKTLWEGFSEVNKSFLDMARLAGLDDLPGLLKANLQEAFASSLQPGTAE